MSQPALFAQSDLDDAVAALERDLVEGDEPRISTMRNYRFAILPYRPKEEFKLRQRVHALTNKLRATGWVVLSVSLQKVFLDRLRTLGDDLPRLIERERRQYAKDPERGLNTIREKVERLVEGPNGIAADVSRVICAFADAHPDRAERAVAFVGRAGALYPFFRTSALLKHLDGRTRNIPVVLLYPGERRENNALSFMGEVAPDTDYRPRIYP